MYNATHLLEPILPLGKKKFAGLDIHITVKDGSMWSRYVLMACDQKYVKEAFMEIKDLLIQYDKIMLVTSPPHCESKA
jgi:hypothetical protein